MNVEEFLSTMDALRFDTSLDEINPELRGMVQKVYPYLRNIYNIMLESGFLTESKINERMEKWYVVDDGEVYNVLPENEFIEGGYEKDQVVKATTNMDMAFNYAEKLNREIAEKSPNFCPPQGYYESKGSKKVSLTESKLHNIICESIKKVMLKEGFLDSFPSMYEKEEKKEDKPKEDEKSLAKRRERVISRLKSDGVDVAQYAYRLWPDKNEDSARSYFYKCLDGKTNDSGDIYKFTSDEINRLYSMLSNDEI